MSLLGSILGGLFGGWVWPWSTKTESYSAITTKSGLEEIEGTDDDDRIVISGAVKALDSGSNIISAGDGQDTLNINGRVESAGDGSNEIFLGEGGSSLKITGPMKAADASSNTINAGDDDDCVTIVGRLSSTDTAMNDIDLGAGDNYLSISLGVAAFDDASNSIVMGDGDDQLKITGGIVAEGQNSFDLGDGDNYIYISGGMSAAGGENTFITGYGDDTVSIWGVTKASDGGLNVVETGAGDDVISLHNTIQEGALLIDAGSGDDTLVLNASRVSLFNNAYEDWLTDYADQYGLDSMNIDTFEVTMTRTAGGLADLDWLKDLTDDAGIQLQLNIDGNGRNLKLGNFFVDGEDDVFSILSMEGNIKNTLTIDGDFVDNGYNGDELTILGNDKDTVKLSDSWEEVNGGDMPTVASDFAADSFRYFSNDEGQMLLIQQDISVIFM